MPSFLSKGHFEVVKAAGVGEMDNNLLALYFQNQQKKVNGVDVVLDTVVDFQVFQNLIDRYPQPNAGRIVKWIFYRYSGKVMIRGEVEIVTPRSFNESMKWWTDKLNAEQQVMVATELKEKESVSVGRSGKGFR